MKTRRLTATLALAFIGVLIALDLGWSTPLDPFKAPPVFALGSGQAASGAHCAALPR
jgi:hypothetical protein